MSSLFHRSSPKPQKSNPQAPNPNSRDDVPRCPHERCGEDPCAKTFVVRVSEEMSWTLRQGDYNVYSEGDCKGC